MSLPVDLPGLAGEYRKTDRNDADFGIFLDAVDAMLHGDPLVRCSQHGYRGTPRCNDNDQCFLQDGVFVPVAGVG